jgi:hypothetical protein
MSNPYTPWHFFIPIIMFAIGTPLLMIADWSTLGIIIYVVAFVLFFCLAWASIWDVFIRKTEALQYLFDSARYLDKDRINDLLVAMGLKPVPVQHTNITITKLDQHGVAEQTRMIYDLPCSIDDLRSMADGLINEHAPFSRREWVDRRKRFSDNTYRKLQERFEKEKIIAPKESGSGFDLTSDGRDYFTKFCTVPSPAPQREEVQTP